MSETSEWFKDTEFWEQLGVWMFDEDAITDAVKEVRNMSLILGLRKGSKVLDLCCGIGRHTLEFASNGYKVTGVDITANFLERAKAEAIAENLEVELVHEDMRSFVRPDAFDAVINYNTSFGYFDDIEDDRKTLRNIYTSLKPDGSFLLGTHGKEVEAKRWVNTLLIKTKTVEAVQTTTISQNWAMADIEWIVFEGEKCKHLKGRHRLYSAVELENELKTVGFSSVEFYGHLDLRPYDFHAKQLVAIAKK